jgi:hypothetical protein
MANTRQKKQTKRRAKKPVLKKRITNLRKMTKRIKYKKNNHTKKNNLMNLFNFFKLQKGGG